MAQHCLKMVYEDLVVGIGGNDSRMIIKDRNSHFIPLSLCSCGLILYGTLCFLDLAGYFLSHVWKFLTIMSSSVFLQVSFLNYSFVWLYAQE